MKLRQKYDYMTKLIVIGDSGVGKTNVILTFTSELFKENYVATIGVDFKVKTLQIDDKKMRLQIWDTAGQERYRTITQTYYKGAAGIVLVYACNDRVSFTNLEKWILQINEKTDGNIKKIIIANKCDLQQTCRQVQKEQGAALAEKYSTPNSKIEFMQTSAKTGQNIEKSFYLLAKRIKQDLQNSYQIDNPKITITKPNKTRQKSGGCSC